AGSSGYREDDRVVEDAPPPDPAPAPALVLRPLRTLVLRGHEAAVPARAPGTGWAGFASELGPVL
ncbi:MAG TPA: hypothetical protein VEJ44_04215, partial [Acidimicrobiales bacterium]|nr:hypothetical protein [Acidimicrobiales bacterium]